MRVLVVGSLPPPESARAGALRTEVVGLLAEGHTVEVVAPDPVATAHRYISASGIPACVRLWTMVSGFDSVVVQLQPGLPVRERAGRLERELSLVALSLVLRRGRHVVVRLESLDDLPGGPAGRGALLLWRSADRIVVGSDAERAALVAAVGAPLESAVTGSRPEHGAPAARADDGGWGEGSDISAENVLELVRMRAARERQELAGESAHLPGWERLPATGVASAELDLAQSRAPERPRTPGDIARSVLAVADRRPVLRPVVRAIRVAYRSARDLLGQVRAN
ncbi:MAG: hypothetical protein ABSF89_03080 [Acidimicrobiales bacterium]